MKQLPGVYPMKDAKGIPYYKASITYKGKHISLGSYPSSLLANHAYQYAGMILQKKQDSSIHTYPENCPISLSKWVILINYRDHGLYIKTPIYLFQNYFLYYVDHNTILKFDVDDLFYYSKHTITKRGGHLFVSDYGMQINIMSRYGIKNYAVCGKDFRFRNGDSFDFRYSNIEVINRFHGVRRTNTNGKILYTAKVHINGDFIIGRYLSEIEAAIAYNKATSLLKEHGCNKEFPENFIDELDEISYSSIYHKIRISKAVRNLTF